VGLLVSAGSATEANGRGVFPDGRGSRVVKVVEEISDNLGRWFARYNAEGYETFSARLLHDTFELGVAWTSNVQQLAGNIAEIQRVVGRPVPRISGTASDGIEAMIKAGRFKTGLYVRHLERRVGGNWRIEIIRRRDVENEVWDIIATRIGD
jgi:hypothetical protein